MKKHCIFALLFDKRMRPPLKIKFILLMGSKRSIEHFMRLWVGSRILRAKHFGFYLYEDIVEGGSAANLRSGALGAVLSRTQKESISSVSLGGSGACSSMTHSYRYLFLFFNISVDKFSGL